MNSSATRIGYARVSTAGHNPEAQIAELEDTGCTMIRTETGSGSSLESRLELGIILDFIHPDETLVVTCIDRLARSMKDLQVIVAKLGERSANIAATEQPVDTSTVAGKAYFDMLGIFAEFETNLRRERQAEGIAVARRRGIYRGRPPKIDMDAIQASNCRRAVTNQDRPRDGVSRGTVYKAKGNAGEHGNAAKGP